MTTTSSWRATATETGYGICADRPRIETDTDAQVSDLAWLGTKAYDKESGRGAVGVEFAETAVSSSGQKRPIEPVAGDHARGMIRRNDEMQWEEGYYRGYSVLTVTPEEATAQFFGERRGSS